MQVMDFWEIPINVVGAVRSPKWKTVRLHHLETNSECICCGKVDDLEVHHIKSVSQHPELELIPENLATLCERCHLVVGHINDWHKINPHIVADSALLRSRHTENPSSTK